MILLKYACVSVSGDLSFLCNQARGLCSPALCLLSFVYVRCSYVDDIDVVLKWKKTVRTLLT